MQNIAQHITKSLHGRTGHGEAIITADGDMASISVDVESSERYAAGVRGITIKPRQPSAGVRDAADRIVERVQELGEPLAVIESDEAGGRAIVRSSTPQQDEGGVTYWEADVQPAQTSLHRYRKDHDTAERRVVTEPLLHATVGRVVEQLADAVTPPAGA